MAAAFAVLLQFMGWLVRPDVTADPPSYTPEQIEAARDARDVSFDPADPPTVHRDLNVEPAGESPLLAELVADGKLPPLAERLPDDPIVMQGPDGVGKYGGTWLRLASSPNDVGQISYRFSGAFLLRWSPLGYPVQPHMARSVTGSPDKRVWTIKLRPGTKWSDGHPYTADDLLYWWLMEIKHPEMGSQVPDWMTVAGKEATVEKLDDYTVRVSFAEPYALFREVLCTRNEFTNTPAHYLRQYHPFDGDEELIAEQMQQYQLPSKRSLYGFMKNWRNPEHPRLWPWIYRTAKSNPPEVFVRNPYFPAVDTAGNQLPYIDRMQFDVQDASMMALSAASGRTSMQNRHIRFEDYTELTSRQEAAGTKVYHWYPATRSVWNINPNTNRRVDPNDPSTAVKAKLLADKRFRQALSLAIDRETIIQADYYGIGEPAQVAPGPESPFHHSRLQNAFVEHDPQRANALLDEIGLTQRDYEGFRTAPDGSRLTFFLDTTAYTGIGPAQFVVEDWAEVGIRCIPRQRNRTLFYAEKDGADFDFNVWSSESDYVPLLAPRVFISNNRESFYAVSWGLWYSLGGMHDSEQSKIPGAIPPPPGSPMRRSMELYDKARRAPTLAEQQELMAKVMDITAENLWTISIATAPPALVVASADMRNIPDNALVGWYFITPSNAGIETFYFENPSDSAGAIAEAQRSILTPTLRPGGRSATGDAGRSWGAVVGVTIRWLVIGTVVLLIAMLAVRHPFVARRLVIMVPTLLIISVVVFSIIQLPPGDFLTTRIAQLQESGDEADLRQIEDLKRLFHYEDPVVTKYLRWMGVYWFASFDQRDAGLLQGNLGRSMESTQQVNHIVGDRIVLTMGISAGTILFTWLMALPIGIYSAVRQYSISDYALTLLGFVGMSVPPFLLALVLMAIANVSGLFSPEYAAQPEWDWGKFFDLLQHIWIPIVVLGVGGTAGMIRVMRANLLDELRKPYVVTARAKGVRPFKLLIKYPVRLALNPFISGIGHIFPQLVSGGAIVAMVLNLPTVGPLLLQGLFSEDMYLAGSMLMVLSLLGIFGTLVSDLLLLWVDPRIRYEGGTR